LQRKAKVVLDNKRNVVQFDEAFAEEIKSEFLDFVRENGQRVYLIMNSFGRFEKIKGFDPVTIYELLDESFSVESVSAVLCALHGYAYNLPFISIRKLIKPLLWGSKYDKIVFDIENYIDMTSRLIFGKAGFKIHRNPFVEIFQILEESLDRFRLLVLASAVRTSEKFKKCISEDPLGCSLIVDCLAKYGHVDCIFDLLDEIEQRAIENSADRPYRERMIPINWDDLPYHNTMIDAIRSVHNRENFSSANDCDQFFVRLVTHSLIRRHPQAMYAVLHHATSWSIQYIMQRFNLFKFPDLFQRHNNMANQEAKNLILKEGALVKLTLEFIKQCERREIVSDLRFQGAQDLIEERHQNDPSIVFRVNSETFFVGFFDSLAADTEIKQRINYHLNQTTDSIEEITQNIMLEFTMNNLSLLSDFEQFIKEMVYKESGIRMR